jgi:hypothetical protein
MDCAAPVLVTVVVATLAALMSSAGLEFGSALYILTWIFLEKASVQRDATRVENRLEKKS